MRCARRCADHDASLETIWSGRFRLSQAEGEGFEPSSDPEARNGFRDRRIRPLCHPSAEPCGQTAGYPLFLQAAIHERFAAGAGLGPAGGEESVGKRRNEEEGGITGETWFPP